MNFKEVYERFLLIADMDQEEGSKWAVLCNEAIEDIQNMCKRHWNISIKYIPREINRVVDFLAERTYGNP